MQALLLSVAAFSPSPLPLRSASSGCGGRAALRRAAPRMPIGVPKVAYRVPGASRADWVDIYNRLNRERIIFLGQEIDDEIVNQIVAVMLFGDSEEPGKPMYLYVNSPGGSVISGLTLYDTMQLIQSEVVTCNIGLAASMGSFILGAGAPGKRLALPHSRVMIHQPMGGARGQARRGALGPARARHTHRARAGGAGG